MYQVTERLDKPITTSLQEQTFMIYLDNHATRWVGVRLNDWMTSNASYGCYGFNFEIKQNINFEIRVETEER